MAHPARPRAAFRRSRGQAGPGRAKQVPPTSASRPTRHLSARAETDSSSPSRPASVSPLERALDAACAVPAPVPVSFTELGLPRPLVAALARNGFTAPFAIQARALPDALAGRDMLGRAQTGGGKTLAFALPMIARLAAAGPAGAAPRGLVLVPTRELAGQVTDTIRPLVDALGLRVTAIFGGAPIGRQLHRLRGGVDIVVATPGRLIDLLDRGACSLAAVEVTVLDEADYMADLGFLPAVTRILNETPAGGQRLLFSATLDRGVDRLVRDYLNDPAFHAVTPAAAPVEAMEHRVFTVRPEDKLPVTTEVTSRPGRTLLFVRTKHGADRLARQLTRAGVPAAAIHGNLTQAARRRSLDGFAAGAPRVLVATDVAARGIHVEGVDLVVHFDPPADHKDYLHRSGRTARAGESGTVLVLVQPHEVHGVRRLHERARVSATAAAVHPGHEAVREIAASGTLVAVAAVPTSRESGRGSSYPPSRGGKKGPRRRADQPAATSSPSLSPSGSGSSGSGSSGSGSSRRPRWRAPRRPDRPRPGAGD